MSSRVALVTGAASGLAAGVALALARDGHRIAFTYRPGGTSPDATLAAVRAFDPGAIAVGNALEGLDEAQALVAEVGAARGPIEIVVHAVGPIVVGGGARAGGGVVRAFARSSWDDYRAMIAGNLDSAVALAFAVLPSMRERNFGRIVYFGMNGSHLTQPAKLMSLYGAAKAGVVTFARTLALEEAARGISVNVIEPGDIRDKTATRTQAASIAAANPTGHAGSWEDIADAVRFAVGDDVGFLNGMVLGVNGGLVNPHE